MSFRHLLEKHSLSRQFFKEVNNSCLSDAGIYLKEGTIVDANWYGPILIARFRVISFTHI